MSYLAHIADRVLGRPLLITPDKAQIIFDVLHGRIVPAALGDEREIADALRPTPDAYRDVAGRDWRTGARMPTYANRGGVAHIPIVGSLVNRGAYVGASSGLVSYEGIHTQVTDAANDDAVTAILLDINSPGGEAGGMFSLAATIREIAQRKPVVALVNDMAASAAYGIAAQATEIIVSPSSIVGSIGVVLMHLDRSGELAAKGIRPTLIHAGAHKVDGHPFGPLPRGVEASLQSEVDKIYGLFTDAVAAGRGRKLSSKAARATEAKTFLGQDAVDRGLADGIASFAEVMADLQKGRKSSTRTAQGARTKMSTNTDLEATAPQPSVIINVGGAGASTETSATAQAAQDGAATGTVEAAAPKQPPAAQAAERDRIKAITTCEEAKGREQLAQHLAFDTDLSADAAKGILGNSPKAAAATAQTYLEQKGADGALGVAPITTKSEPSHKAGWGKAIADANRVFDNR